MMHAVSYSPTTLDIPVGGTPVIEFGPPSYSPAKPAPVKTKRIGIIQSNYIPWKGYFDIVNMVDEFILYDTAQYTKNDWRNRNRIKTQQGVQWLTIPVFHDSLCQTIRETKISDPKWAKKHWTSLSQSYAKAPCFKYYKPVFEELYLGNSFKYLSDANFAFIAAVNGILGIQTKIRFSDEYELTGDREERLVGVVRQAGGRIYLSGPSARNYITEKMSGLLADAGITMEWMDYSGYPEYNQLFPPFEHAVSIVDLIFNHGTDARRYMKSF